MKPRAKISMLAIGLMLHRRIVWGVLLGGLLLGAALAWLGLSQSGLQTLAALGESASSGRLHLSGVEGHLLGSIRVGEIIWRDAPAQQEVSLSELQLDWRPDKLLARQLEITRLEITRLEVRLGPGSDDSPLSLPQSLSLPGSVGIRALSIQTLSVTGLPAPVQGLRAVLHSDGRSHHLQLLAAHSEQLALSADVQLAGESPFALSANALIKTAGEQALAMALQGEGSLEKLRVKLLASGSLSGAGQLELQPFGALPLTHAQLALDGLNPADWYAAAPSARLALEVSLGLEGARSLRGSFDVRNSLPGRIDQNRLPLLRVQSQFRAREEDVVLPNWQATISGAGQLSGQARWRPSGSELSAKVSNLDVSRWHASLMPTHFAGSIDAKLVGATQSVTLDLNSPRIKLQGALEHDGKELRLKQLQLASGRAQLDASGRLSMDKQQGFALQARLAQLDLKQFARLPASNLNATIKAEGSLAPKGQSTLQFELTDSLLDGHPLKGVGQLSLRTGRLEVEQLRLDAAGNHLSAQGKLGLMGDELVLDVDAPALDKLGLRGALKLNARVRDSFKAPAIVAHIASPMLGVGDVFDLHALDADIRVGSGQDDPLNITLALQKLSGANFAPVSDVHVQAKGSRRAHTLELGAHSAAVSGVLTAAGGLDEEQHWQGLLNTLALQVFERPLKLLHPARVQLGAKRASVEAADFDFAGGRIRLGDFSWLAGQLVSHGRIEALPVSALAKLEGALLLDGSWDVRLDDEHVAGKFLVQRSVGDVHLPNGTALGLNALRANVEVNDKLLRSQIEARGSVFGKLSADASLALAHTADGGWAIDRTAPLRGSLDADMPDLAWLGSLIGSGSTSAGRLVLKGQLAGSVEHPDLNGALHGQDLGVYLADYGLRLENGSLDASLERNRLRLDTASFQSRATQKPRDRRIPATELMSHPGRLEAEGDLDIFSGAGLLNVKLDRIAALQGPLGWLMVSGETRLGLAENRLAITGALRADGGYFEMPPVSAPKLSEDVFVSGREDAERKPLRLELDLTADLGPALYFKGAGLDTRLAGQLRLRNNDRGAPRLNGSIQTDKGMFTAYGTALTVERGILNFQGQLDNPGLNVLAMRRGQAVEAGVELSGSVKQPRARLVSEPDVPDQEKLSWMVLGHGPDQSSGADSALLISAASGLLGDNRLVHELKRNLGIDEISIRSGSLDGSSTARGSRVASNTGFGGSSDMQNEQIFSVGKRIGDKVTLAYEESLASAGSIVKITLQLTRAISLVGRTGSENSVDAYYALSFGK